MKWWRRLAKSTEAERQLSAELHFHIESAIADHVNGGMSESDARRQVRLQFGGLEQVKEECRDARGLQSFDSWTRDFRHAWRSLRRTPGFTAVAILTLALGIGVNATVFTVTNAVLFKGFPMVRDNYRLLYLTYNDSVGCCVSYPDFLDWKAQAKSFEEMAIVHGVGTILTDENGFPERYETTEVSSNTFHLVGQKPILGRDFAPADEAPGAAPVAMLSYDFWERRYSKDPAILGRATRVNGVPTTVIGIMPAGFSFPQKLDLWVPLVQTPEVLKRENRDTWMVIGRLAPGVTRAAARGEMELIGKRLAVAYPVTNRERLPALQNFTEFFIGPNATLLYGAMWGAVGFVLLIACANLANLLLARAVSRSREISIRMALGAGRWRIIRQLLMESVLLSGLGGGLGWWIAKLGVRGYAAAMSFRASWLIVDYTMDSRVLAYLIAISIATGLLFGLAPALQLSKLDVNSTLKDGGRGATSGARGKHLSSLLVIGETALALVLLAAAGVMIRSFLKVHNASLGVNTANVLMGQVKLPAARYSAAAQLAFFDHLANQLKTIPGVETVALADSAPQFGAPRLAYEIAGAPSVDERNRPKNLVVVTGPGYFQTLEAALLAGRDFNEQDVASHVPVAIVNQRFASKFWPGESALGKRLRLFDRNTPGPWLTVAGVVSDIVQNDQSRQRIDPVIYLPYRQKPEQMMLFFARTRVAPESLAHAFRSEVQKLDPDLPMFGPFTLDHDLEVYSNNRFYGILFLIFAAIALLLAAIGLYTVVAHSVSQRTQEFGIRMASGATASDVLKLVFKQGMMPLGIGLLLGLVASFAINRLLKTELVQISPADPVTYLVVSAALLLAATLGCWIPARRAIRINPVEALRWE